MGILAIYSFLILYSGVHEGPSKTLILSCSTLDVTVRFMTTDQTVNEDAGTVLVCLTKDRDTDGPFTVSVTVAEEAGVDNPATGK